MNETNKMLLDWVILDIQMRGLKEQFNDNKMSYDAYCVMGAPLMTEREALADRYHNMVGDDIHYALPKDDPALDLPSFIKSLI